MIKKKYRYARKLFLFLYLGNHAFNLTLFTGFMIYVKS